MWQISNFFTKSTDTGLSVLFVFFKAPDRLKSALKIQKWAFYTLRGTSYCCTLYTLLHCVQQYKTAYGYLHKFIPGPWLG